MSLDFQPNQKLSLFLLQKQLADFVNDSVNLEGISCTVPEVQTLMEGISIGGRKLEEELIIHNQISAWRFLIKSVRENTFDFSKPFVCQLHAIAARDESLTWGAFRDGSVSISGTSYIPPDYQELDHHWNKLEKIICPVANELEAINIDKIYAQAISVFLQIARDQFFFDVNKRTGRLMMNGILLAKGLPAINLPASRKLEFNQLMLDFYSSNNEKTMCNFMLSCLDKQYIKIMKECPESVKSPDQRKIAEPGKASADLSLDIEI